MLKVSFNSRSTVTGKSRPSNTYLYLGEKKPSAISWKEGGVKYVMTFTDRSEASEWLQNDEKGKTLRVYRHEFRHVAKPRSGVIMDWLDIMPLKDYHNGKRGQPTKQDRVDQVLSTEYGIDVGHRLPQTFDELEKELKVAQWEVSNGYDKRTMDDVVVKLLTIYIETGRVLSLADVEKSMKANEVQ